MLGWDQQSLWGGEVSVVWPCSWRKEGQGELETDVEHSGSRAGASPVGRHCGTSSLRPASPGSFRGSALLT